MNNEYPAEEKKGILRRLFLYEIPLWSAILMLFVICIIAGGLFYYYGDEIYNYTLNISDSDNVQSALSYGSYPQLSNANFFAEVKSDFIEDKASFIEADLSSMQLRVYKEGVLATEIKILSKGREGSWWETPAGLYKIEWKKDNHFSSFGKVYQPWSMAFQGNFFIHGWPYYPDGTAVSSTYSGGCIRLSDEDAKTVYDLAESGMPVLVYEKDFSSDAFTYEQKKPQLTAEKYLVADLKNNFVFLEQGSKEQVPIASLTKLMTGLVAAEYINLDNEVTVSEAMIVKTSVPRLVVGQKVTAYNLLFPLLLESSNEAAEALASRTGRGAFVAYMNNKAKALGMSHTVFSDPSGMSDNNVSTAEELFSLAKYIYNNRSFLFNLSAGNLKGSAYGPTIFTGLANFNTVAGAHAELVGGKVGEITAAGKTALYVFNVSTSEGKRPVAIILLNSEDREADAREALLYIQSQFE